MSSKLQDEQFYYIRFVLFLECRERYVGIQFWLLCAMDHTAIFIVNTALVVIQWTWYVLTFPSTIV